MGAVVAGFALAFFILLVMARKAMRDARRPPTRRPSPDQREVKQEAQRLSNIAKFLADPKLFR